MCENLKELRPNVAVNVMAYSTWFINPVQQYFVSILMKQFVMDDAR